MESEHVTGRYIASGTNDRSAQCMLNEISSIDQNKRVHDEAIQLVGKITFPRLRKKAIH